MLQTSAAEGCFFKHLLYLYGLRQPTQQYVRAIELQKCSLQRRRLKSIRKFAQTQCRNICANPYQNSFKFGTIRGLKFLTK